MTNKTIFPHFTEGSMIADLAIPDLEVLPCVVIQKVENES